MKEIYIDRTKSTPKIVAKDSRVSLEGVALPEDSRKFFDPLEKWIRDFEGEQLIFNISLYYFNTSVSKNLLEMLKLADRNDKIGSLIINWHYESDDMDMVESGEIYENALNRAEFNYIELAESY